MNAHNKQWLLRSMFIYEDDDLIPYSNVRQLGIVDCAYVVPRNALVVSTML